MGVHKHQVMTSSSYHGFNVTTSDMFCGGPWKPPNMSTILSYLAM